MKCVYTAVLKQDKGVGHSFPINIILSDGPQIIISDVEDFLDHASLVMNT